MAYDLTLGAVAELGRSGDRVTCSATFSYVRPADRAQDRRRDVLFTVMQPADGSLGTVELPADQMTRIAAPP